VEPQIKTINKGPKLRPTDYYYEFCACGIFSKDFSLEIPMSTGRLWKIEAVVLAGIDNTM
jgi:hypothetical protein